MTRGLRTAILAALVIGVGATPAAARFILGCANPADSALNQYCETVPNARGPQTPTPGSPALGISVPGAVAAQLAQANGFALQTQPRHALLKVPAAERIRL